MSIVVLPGAARCSHVDPDTGERCITYLERRNAGPQCHVHSRRKPVRQSLDRLVRERPTPSAEAVADGLRHLGVKVTLSPDPPTRQKVKEAA